MGECVRVAARAIALKPMSDDQSYWRIKHAFEQLIELTGTQRANKLAQLQRDQPELASALVSRLARLEGLHEPVDAADAASKPSIAGYTLLQLAGAGGMGKVWLAQRDGEPEQKLALKQLHAEQPDAELLRRFAQERRVLARLNHPHIAALVDAGVDDRGKPYLVTAWVDGERIDRWCELNQANRRERVRLIRDIAAALSYAHAQLIVHRDLKPANILVDRGGQVRLLDFGIAKRLEPEVSEPLVTAIPIMTLRYAAPEQVAGESIGPACDLYALGVLLFELISGRSPYPDCSDPSALCPVASPTITVTV